MMKNEKVVPTLYYLSPLLNSRRVLFNANDILQFGLDTNAESKLKKGGAIISIPKYFTAQQVREIVKIIEEIPCEHKNIFTSTEAEQWSDMWIFQKK
ncbi:hypothetical protein [Serratia oryzae]|uniref:Uncharacterized protein n=1 Tax=Serratia oryzae TaxID=2034155 RepID=A0A1S8CFV1_9GAMM|nr:hypothetical protein [Serratia oryzae]OMQ20870.1 hypothetical protein BMI79_17310 [Serratia oryzae]